MAIHHTAHELGVYRVAERFLDRALARSGSLYDAARVWTRPACEGLAARVEQHTGAGEGSFDDRWQALLADAPQGVIRLAAEVVHLHVLFPADLTVATKRRLLQSTLVRLDDAPRLPDWTLRPLDGGVAGTGVAFKTLRLSQLGFLPRAVGAWKRLPAPRRRELLAAPEAFGEWLRSVPAHGGHSQREALLHLLFPEAFEAIVSRSVKQRIVAAWPELAPEDPDPDAALRVIRQTLAARHGEHFSFADPELASRWQSGARR